MQCSAQYHKDMENGVHPLSGPSQAVQNSADAVGDAAGKQQQESGKCHDLQQRPPEGDHSPAHADVADHGENA